MCNLHRFNETSLFPMGFLNVVMMLYARDKQKDIHTREFIEVHRTQKIQV